MALDELLDKAKESAGNLVDKTKETAGKFLDLKEYLLGDEEKEFQEEFKDSTSTKMQSMAQSITDSISLLNESGYEFKGIGVELGLALGFTLTFHFKKDISDEDKAALLEKASDRKIVTLILRMLFKADKFYKSMKVGVYELDNVNISLGLPPGMNLSFKKIE